MFENEIFIAGTYTSLYYTLHNAKEGEEQFKAILIIMTMFMTYGYNEKIEKLIIDSEAKECLRYLHSSLKKDGTLSEMKKLKECIMNAYNQTQSTNRVLN